MNVFVCHIGVYWISTESICIRFFIVESKEMNSLIHRFLDLISFNIFALSDEMEIVTEYVYTILMFLNLLHIPVQMES